MVTRRPAGSRAPAERRLAATFVAESRWRLWREYLPKIRRVVRRMSPEDLWWRANRSSNSIGNLVLHLEGNLRQWIVAGVGGRADRRDRDAEFAARGGHSGHVLLARLERCVRDADAVLASLAPDDLLDWRTIQGYRVTVLQAVYHVVEHFSGHTGQILYAAKLRLDRDLDFYPHLRASQPTRRRRPRSKAFM